MESEVQGVVVGGAGTDGKIVFDKRFTARERIQQILSTETGSIFHSIFFIIILIIVIVVVASFCGKSPFQAED